MLQPVGVLMPVVPPTMPVLTLAPGFMPLVPMSLAPTRPLLAESVIVSEVPSTSQVVSQAEMEEPSEAMDIVKQVIEESFFEERIEMVGDILKTELLRVMKRSSNFAMSVHVMAAREGSH